MLICCTCTSLFPPSEPALLRGTSGAYNFLTVFISLPLPPPPFLSPCSCYIYFSKRKGSTQLPSARTISCCPRRCRPACPCRYPWLFHQGTTHSPLLFPSPPLTLIAVGLPASCSIAPARASISPTPTRSTSRPRPSSACSCCRSQPPPPPPFPPAPHAASSAGGCRRTAGGGHQQHAAAAVALHHHRSGAFTPNPHHALLSTFVALQVECAPILTSSDNSTRAASAVHQLFTSAYRGAPPPCRGAFPPSRAAFPP